MMTKMLMRHANNTNAVQVVLALVVARVDAELANGDTSNNTNNNTNNMKHEACGNHKPHLSHPRVISVMEKCSAAKFVVALGKECCGRVIYFQSSVKYF